MGNQVVKWKNGSTDGVIVVRPGTVADEIIAVTIRNNVASNFNEDAIGHWKTFGDVCSQTVKSSGLPFVPETIVNADKATQLDAYRQFIQLPQKLVRAWLNALDAADGSFDVTFGPVPLPGNADPE